MKTATATTSLDIWVMCPYCKISMSVHDKLIDSLQENLRVPDIEKEIICDHDTCGEVFKVTEITY